jgi:hypothetical protein
MLVFAFVVISFSSCKKDKEITCNLNTGDQADVEMTITFSATKTGDGVISSLTYKTSEKEETISNPILPWTIDVDAAEASDFSIVAEGTVKDGSITVAYHGLGLGSEMEGSDYCSHSND